MLQGQGCAQKKFISKNYSALDNTGTNDNSPDSYFDLQWYLGGKSVASTFNISAKSVWDEGNMGQEVSIAIVDPSSIYLSHPDLNGNKDLDKSFNFIAPQKGTDTTLDNFESHGTCVAGVIGAREMNGKGIRGISSRALISARNTTGVDTDVYDALTYKATLTDVASNSYGPPDDTGELNLYYDNDLFNQAIAVGTQQGRGGLGTVFVWAAGNGREYGDRSNYDGYASNFGVISVCSVGPNGNVSFFSEPGSNLWVCAPGEKIVTTDYKGLNCSDGSNLKGAINSDYTKNFIGTSAATPVVSGVAGLVLREAKIRGKYLGWRDVKMIIAESATKPSTVTWQPTRLRFNDDYGFGIVNAEAAVSKVASWLSVGNTPWTRKVLGANLLGPTGSGSLDDTGGSYLSMQGFKVDNTQVENGVNLFNSSINYIEYINLELKLTHSSPGDLEVSIVRAPLSGGTSSTSKILTPHACWDDSGNAVSCTAAVNYTYKFGISNFLGESVQGNWDIKIKDANSNGKSGTVTGWRLTFYGH